MWERIGARKNGLSCLIQPDTEAFLHQYTIISSSNHYPHTCSDDSSKLVLAEKQNSSCKTELSTSRMDTSRFLNHSRFDSRPKWTPSRALNTPPFCKLQIDTWSQPTMTEKTKSGRQKFISKMFIQPCVYKACQPTCQVIRPCNDDWEKLLHC